MTTQATATVTSKDGIPIAYWSSGQGAPLVLIHGTTADHTRWRSVLGLFEPHATVYAIDRRGRGGSGDAEPYSLEREFEDVAAVAGAVAEESGGPVDIFGHSYGALCALEGSLLTTNVRRLVLYEPPVLFDDQALPPGLVERLEKLLAEGQREEVVATFFREVVGMPPHELEAIRSLPAWKARVSAAHTIPREERAGSEFRFDPARYRSLGIPVLLLDGDKSPEFLRRSTRAVAEAIQDSRVVVLEGQQHVAIDTIPEFVADTVLSFLQET